MPSEPIEINAMPTKGLFIDMLVKDVDLIDCISDLVDNSIDGAKRLRPDGDYAGLKITITFNTGSFIIEDNCGGISLDVAINQAFRFGRPVGTKATTGSVGQFGLGMKRALFKLGKWFQVSITAEKEEFSLTVDVDKWSESDLPNAWNFKIDDGLVQLPEGEVYSVEQRKTRIEVRQLRPEAIRQFENPAYNTDFQAKLSDAQNEFLDKGLAIEVNGTYLNSEKFQMLFSDDLKPAHVSSTPMPQEAQLLSIIGLG